MCVLVLLKLTIKCLSSFTEKNLISRKCEISTKETMGMCADEYEVLDVNVGCRAHYQVFTLLCFYL